MKNIYQNKKITIWGLGKTGISCMNFFIKKGIYPQLVDSEQNRDKLKFLHKIPQYISLKLGKNIESWILQSNLIIISPGISLFHSTLIKASKLGIEIIGDIELFCRETRKPIIAITGSNGKTTVTTMLTNIVNNSKLKAGIGGNIGTPALDILNKSNDLYILELSSFQLETIYSLQAKIAIVLNITPDHINRYPSGFNLYKKTKLNIYNNANICIENTQYNFLKEIAYQSFQKKITFGIKQGDYHLIQESSKIWLSFKNKKLINLKYTLLNGLKNFENALATLAISDAIGLPRHKSLSILSKFNGLDHRFQTVHIKNKIRWINDSKSTNIGSTIAAIENINLKGTLWLLLGGDSKSANFNLLKKHLNNKKIKIYCYGKDGKIILNTFPKIAIYVHCLRQAIELIKKKVQPNDIVLLSPACSSTDQFLNFEERGNLFTKLVKQSF